MNINSNVLDINEIKKFFQEELTENANSSSFIIKTDNNKIKIHLEVIPEVDSEFFLVSVYTSNCHLQLHNCSRIVVSQMLEELIFISENETNLSGLIISKNGDCAMYSNVLKKDINSDLSELSSEKLLAAVALSITES